MAAEPLAQPTPADVRPQSSHSPPHRGSQIFELGDRLLSLARIASEVFHGGKGTTSPVQGVLSLAEAGVLKGMKNALDVRGHVRRHPWLAVGCAAALGFFCAGMLRRN